MKDEEEKTMFAVRLTKTKTEVMWLVLILAMFFAVLVIVGGVQYIICLDKDPEAKMGECFRWGKR